MLLINPIYLGSNSRSVANPALPLNNIGQQSSVRRRGGMTNQPEIIAPNQVVESIHEAGGGQPQGIINVDHGEAPHIELEVRSIL